jgi:hypothetical protein
MRCSGYGVAAVLAGACLWVALAGAGAAHAAGIAWEKRGAVESCLDGQAQKWIEAKVGQIVNDDPAVSNINDATVAEWAALALSQCATTFGDVNPASERQFTQYIAHWREHLYKAADDVRKRVQPD